MVETMLQGEMEWKANAIMRATKERKSKEKRNFAVQRTLEKIREQTKK